jgi:hypothetical protein
MIAGSSGSTHGDSTLKTPAPNAAMSEGICGSVMSYDRRAKVLILGVNDCPRIPRPGVAYGRAKLHTYGRDILK